MNIRARAAPVCSVSGSATAVGPTPQVVNCSVGKSRGKRLVSSRYLRYQINTNPPAAGNSYVNTVTVSSNEVDSNSANNSASEPTAVRAKADLALTSKTAVDQPRRHFSTGRRSSGRWS